MRLNNRPVDHRVYGCLKCVVLVFKYSSYESRCDGEELIRR